MSRYMKTCHFAMLFLAGYDYDGRRRMRDRDFTDDERLDLILHGRSVLRRLTGQDFGFDLEAWHNFLLSAHSDEYLVDPWYFGYVEKIVQHAVTDESRERLIKWRERYGPLYLRRLLAAPEIPYGTKTCHEISSEGGVYHIVQTDSRKTIYMARSPNMRSHMLGHQVKAIVKRKLKTFQQQVHDTRRFILRAGTTRPRTRSPHVCQVRRRAPEAIN